MSQPFKLIGDPHITRKFEFGVPLARKGERERLLFNDFENRLNSGDQRMVIMVGDLFEKPICNLQDLYQTLKMLLDAARNQPDRKFIMMAGNHDISPQDNVKGAFDILYLFNGLVPNLKIVMKPTVIDGVALFPWQWNRTALDQLDDVQGMDFKYAVGHWDLVLYDENHADHLCPARELTAMGAEKLFSGHWHVAGVYKIRGVEVACTGSMQPMTHSEDPHNRMYVTLTVEEYEDADPETFKNKYVRVLAAKGEEVTDLPDCLGFKVQRIEKVEALDDHDTTVDVGEFNLAEIVDQQLAEHDVPDDVSSELKEKLNVTD